MSFQEFLDEVDERKDNEAVISFWHPKINLKYQVAHGCQNYGIIHPMMYAVHARVEHYLIEQARKNHNTGETKREIANRLIAEFDLKNSRYDGITIDWIKIREQIYVPRMYLESQKSLDHRSTIFTMDEGQAGGIDEKHQPMWIKHTDLTDIITSISNDLKIWLLATNEEWRKLAERYARTMIKMCRTTIEKGKKVDHKWEYTIAVKEMIDYYMTEMKL